MQTVGGKYSITGVLGEGGMGVVYDAVHVPTQRPVALKRPHLRLRQEKIVLARFEREARAAGRIRSEHVVQLLDVDHDADGPYLVMERLTGESLSARLERTPRLSPDAIFQMGDELLAGVAAAHRAGVIHRDLKPGNIFFERREGGSEIVKIVDFGISKISDRSSELTVQGELLGTVSHVSPEQIRRDAVTHRSDLWSIGVILYRCLAGFNPFEAEDNLSVLARILEQPPTPLPREVPAPVRHAFAPFIRRALAKRPEERFASAEEMRGALRVVSELLNPRPRGHGAGALDASSSGIGSALRLGPHGAKIVAAAALLAVCLGAGVGAIRAHEGTAPSFALDVPDPAEVTLDGLPVVDRSEIPLPSGPGHVLRVSAPGRIARSVPIPERPGARISVRLARDEAPSRSPAASPPSSALAAAPVATAPDKSDDDIEIVDAPRPAKPAVRARPAPAASKPAPSGSSARTVKPVPRNPY